VEGGVYASAETFRCLIVSGGCYVDRVSSIGAHVSEFDGISHSLGRGGFARVPDRFHSFIHEAVVVPSCALCRCIRLSSSAIHFAAMSTSSHSSMCFGF